MSNKQLLEALSQDLYRVAIGLHSGSTKMAERFSKEILDRKEELELETLKPYIRKIITNLPQTLSQQDSKKAAEDALVYSILLQNYSLSASFKNT
ncbi:MAG: hypothetical protein HY430_02320 [Candidatus Levybacteria bacterium]|nr:hypothetical protein [Candidatus Levybacteria bacterium]